MFSAIVSLRSCLKIVKYSDPSSLYWGIDGSGGKALFKADSIVSNLEKLYGLDDWEQYHFFRYANSLLFDDPTNKWSICSECGAMTGTHEIIGKSCKGSQPFGKKDCKGIMKALEWTDLEPYKKK